MNIDFDGALPRQSVVRAEMLLAWARGGHVSATDARRWLGGRGGFSIIGGPKTVEALRSELHRIARGTDEWTAGA